MAPIRRGDGTALVPNGIKEIRKGDGTVLWSADAIPNSGVSRWKFNGDAVDSWGNNDGTVTGATFQSSGGGFENSGYVSTDGVDDLINMGEGGGDFDFGTGDFAVAVWLRVGTSSDFEWVVDKSGTTFLFGKNTNNNLRWWIGGTSVDLSANIADGTWNHYVWTRNSGTVKVYENGSEIGSNTNTNDMTSNSDLIVGNYSENSTDNWSGDIDDLRMYSDGLSATQASNLYSTGSISG